MIRTMAKQIPGPVVTHQPSTVAEISQAMAALSKRAIALRNEIWANNTAMKSGSAPSRALSDHENRVAAHIKLLMNGSTPPHLLVPPVSREEQIRAELDAIAFVERDLGRQEMVARHQEAEQWVVGHATEWKSLCREIVLAAVKLARLEERARNMLEPIHGSYVGGLVMAATIGRFSLLGIGDPLQEMQANALKDGVVTSAELKKAAADAS
jgi:hypothetical protein